MKHFAVIENGIVIDICVAETIEVIQEAHAGKTCVEYTEENPAILGLGYDGTTFEQPPVRGLVTLEEVEEMIARGERLPRQS